MRFVESGIILIVSVGAAAILGGFIVMLIVGQGSSTWTPSKDTSFHFVVIFCASVQAAYQEYLNRKLSRTAQVIEHG